MILVGIAISHRGNVLHFRLPVESRLSTECEKSLQFAIIVDVRGLSDRRIETVFLDRDGVINRKMPEGQYVRCWNDFEILPGVADAVSRLNHAGLRVIVVSNQRGIALGLYTPEDVNAIHEGLQQILRQRGARVDRFYICPHDRGGCDCRKPLTGMFRRAQADFPSVKADTSVMVGDSISDVEFGRRVGMCTIRIVSGPETGAADKAPGGFSADFTCGSLQEAADIILHTDTSTET
jgi:D-glycero-D-manno-heptose 1,7-bisphosphate phosphatase